MEDKKQLFQQVIDTFKQHKFRKQEAQEYLNWIKLYLSYHKLQNPLALGSKDVKAFLQYLSQEKGLMPSRQKQAYLALTFFYDKVLQRSIWSNLKLDDDSRPNQQVENTPAEYSVQVEHTPKWLNLLQEPYRLIARLSTQCGLQLEEILNLRLEDVDIAARHLRIRDVFDDYSEIFISDSLMQPLALQLKKAQNAFNQDSRQGPVFFRNPGSSQRKELSNNHRWYFLFPGTLQFNLHTQQRIRDSLEIGLVRKAIAQAKSANHEQTTSVPSIGEQIYSVI